MASVVSGKRIPKKWVQWLSSQPETGMGYHVVDVLLSDGSVVPDVAIIQSEIIGQVRGREGVPFDPEQIVELRLTHKRWNFGGGSGN